jgi:hypothetical protein
MATLGTFAVGQVLTAQELNNAIPLCILENSSVSLTNNVTTSIPYPSEILDPLNWHDNSTNNTRITPNIAGYYLVTIVINNVSVGLTRALTALFKNGAVTTIPIAFDGPGTIDDFTASGYVTANGTTDYFEQVALVSGANKTSIRTQFSMQFVRPL